MRRSHTQLMVWRSGMRLVTDVYRVTQGFPPEERYGLSQQVRRAAVSIPSNIAEGAARGSNKDFLRFLYIARGSLAELETQLMIARKLGYCQDLKELSEATDRVFAQLAGLIRRLNTPNEEREAADV